VTTIAKCTHCDSAFKIKDHLVGKAVRCPRCGEAFRVESKAVLPPKSSKPASKAPSQAAVAVAKSSGVDPLASAATSAPSSSEGFFDAHEDVDAIYAANVVSAKYQKRRRQLTVLIASGSLAAIMLIVGTVVAFQYAYDNAAIPLELADPRSVDVEKLDGTWRPHADTHWGYAVRMPGEPEVSGGDDRQPRLLSLRDQQLGTMKFEIRKEAHPEWSEFFAKVDRDEIFQGVPAGNIMKISSETSYQTDSITVHRYILVSKESRLTKNVAVVHKFSVDGKTVTVLWSGPRKMLRSPEVLYFFSSAEISGVRYITH